MIHENAVAAALANANASGVAVNFSGVWKNQMDSVMELTVAGGHVTGTYKSASSGNGPPIVSKDLKGFVAGDLISLLVLWPGGSMTAWTGQMTDENDDPGTGKPDRIRTLWHLVTEIPDPNEDSRLWQSTWAGADEFTRRQ